MSRFARSAPTQATGGRRHDRRDPRACATATPAPPSTNRLDDDALRDAARRARRRRARAAARAGPGDHPGLAEPRPTPRRPRRLRRRRPRAWIRRARRARCATAFAVAAEHGLEAFGVWTAGAVRTAIASSTGVRARRRRHRRVHEGRLPRRATGAAATRPPRRGAAARLDAEALARARRRARSPREPLAELGPGEYPVVLEPTPSAGCSSSSAASRSTASPTPRAAARSAGRLGEQRRRALDRPRDDAARSPRTLPRALRPRGRRRRRRCRSSRDGVAEARRPRPPLGGARRRRRALDRPRRRRPGGSPYGPVPDEPRPAAAATPPTRPSSPRRSSAAST